uniref:Uncharacterized protein n=1 Tax=Cannabis sativa TaxID=3483 RepID=A0A803QRL4_CANSA
SVRVSIRSGYLNSGNVQEVESQIKVRGSSMLGSRFGVQVQTQVLCNGLGPEQFGVGVPSL